MHLHDEKEDPRRRGRGGPARALRMNEDDPYRQIRFPHVRTASIGPIAAFQGPGVPIRPL